jgi:nitrogen fixation NifU-like protein
MAGDSDDLYQRVVLDHAQRPRNQGPLPDATHQARGDNPFCGDRWLVSLVLDGDQLREARCQGTGCAISTAAASMMTEAVRGRTRDEVQRLSRAFERLLAGGDAAPDGDAQEDARRAIDLGELAAFAGVRRYPVRVKCARLPWQTLIAALGGEGATVSTE